MKERVNVLIGDISRKCGGKKYIWEEEDDEGEGKCAYR